MEDIQESMFSTVKFSTFLFLLPRLFTILISRSVTLAVDLLSDSLKIGTGVFWGVELSQHTIKPAALPQLVNSIF